MKALNRDFWASIIGLAVAIIFSFASFYKTDAEVYLFPRIIAIAIFLLALIQCVLAYKRFSKLHEREQERVSIAWKELFPGLFIAVAYVLLLELVGFYVSAFLAFLSIVLIYGKRSISDKKALIIKFSIGTILISVLYFLFWYLLNVRTPTGWLL